MILTSWDIQVGKCACFQTWQRKMCMWILRSQKQEITNCLFNTKHMTVSNVSWYVCFQFPTLGDDSKIQNYHLGWIGDLFCKDPGMICGILCRSKSPNPIEDQNYVVFTCISWIYPPPSNSHKWRFIGFPTKNGIILVVTVAGWGVDPMYNCITNCLGSSFEVGISRKIRLGTT